MDQLLHIVFYLMHFQSTVMVKKEYTVLVGYIESFVESVLFIDVQSAWYHFSGVKIVILEVPNNGALKNKNKNSSGWIKNLFIMILKTIT